MKHYSDIVEEAIKDKKVGEIVDITPTVIKRGIGVGIIGAKFQSTPVNRENTTLSQLRKPGSSKREKK
jgi:hypothetical protein